MLRKSLNLPRFLCAFQANAPFFCSSAKVKHIFEWSPEEISQKLQNKKAMRIISHLVDGLRKAESPEPNKVKQIVEILNKKIKEIETQRLPVDPSGPFGKKIQNTQHSSDPRINNEGDKLDLKKSLENFVMIGHFEKVNSKETKSQLDSRELRDDAEKQMEPSQQSRGSIEQRDLFEEEKESISEEIEENIQKDQKEQLDSNGKPIAKLALEQREEFSKIQLLQELQKLSMGPFITLLENRIGRTVVISALSNYQLYQFLVYLLKKKYWSNWIKTALSLTCEKIDLKELTSKETATILNWGCFFLLNHSMKRFQLKELEMFLKRVSEHAYFQIKEMNLNQVVLILRCLANLNHESLGIRINAPFIKEVANRAHSLILAEEKQKVKNIMALKSILKNISVLEKKLSPKGGWLVELDPLYETITQVLMDPKNASKFSLIDLGIIASSLSRASFYGSKFAFFLLKKVISSKEIPHLNLVSQVFHYMAITGVKEVNPKSLDQTLSFLEDLCILYEKTFVQKGEIEGATHLGLIRLMWSWCVVTAYKGVGGPQRAAKSIGALYRILNISNQQSSPQLNKKELFQLFSVLIYTREKGVFHPETEKAISESFKQFSDSKIEIASALHLEVCECLTKMRIPYEVEGKIEGISVDVIIKVPGKPEAAIEVNGYQHYFRNMEELKGNSMFKENILTEVLKTKVLVVPIFEWQLLSGQEEKIRYLQKKMEKKLSFKFL